MMRRRRRNPRSRSAKGKSEAAQIQSDIEGTSGEDTETSAQVERQPFGAAGLAWMDVKISEDALTATIKSMTLGGDTTLRSADILNTLREQFHITYGLDEKLIDNLTKLALADSQRVVTGNYCIAKGTPPAPGSDGRIVYTFRSRLEKGFRLRSRRLRTAFSETTVQSLLDKCPPGLLVRPGEALARRVAPTEGESGHSIFGNDIPSLGIDPPLRAGTNVSEADGFYLAEACGYVCLIDDQLSIQPPFWIAPDKMSAHFISLEQAGTTPVIRGEWLLESLAALGVTHGIDESKITGLCQSPPAGSKNSAIAIALGTEPVHGKDTSVDFTFDLEKRAGTIMPDGSIDLRERNSSIGIEEGQPIGSVVAATKGCTGRNICGEIIPVEDGEEICFEAGENVRAEGDPAQEFFAEKTGNIYLSGQSIHVKEVFHVPGDVDYEVGNIETPKDVQIDGHVKAGFSVKAGGSISVSGLIESGATITARGDIIASQGIVGEGTKLIAQGAISMGSIQAKFIQNASVLARGDIVVGCYIYNSNVRAVGDLTVQTNGGGRAGSIVGGESYASRKVHCHIAGSASASNTVIGIKAAPELIAHITKLDKSIGQFEAQSLRLVRAMGLQTVDVNRIKAAVESRRGASQKLLHEKALKVYELVDSRDKLAAERDKLIGQQNSALDLSEIHVEKILYAGVQIKIGENAIKLVEDIDGQVFSNSLHEESPNHITNRQA